MFRYKTLNNKTTKYNSMKNSKVIKISEKNWERLKHSNKGSIDKSLNILMDIVEKDMPIVEYSNDNLKSINVYNDTVERLDSFRISDTESRNNIITRLLLVFDELDTQEEIEIQFKLTSPINNKLYIIGIVTSKEIHILGNSEDTLEFKAWKKILDWTEIRELCLTHKDERISFNKTNYRIDINYI